MIVEKKNDFGHRSGLMVVFLYFSYVVFSFMQMQSHPLWLRNLAIAMGMGIATALFFLLLRFLFAHENTKIWISRVFRSISVSCLIYGFLVLPLLKSNFEGRGDFSFESFAYKFSRNLDELFVVQEWTFLGSAFAVTSFALWKNRCSAVVAALGMVLFHYCLFSPSSAWFWR